MVAQCFVGNPYVVLLDEPLNGLDPVEADRLRRFIFAQRGQRTIVISSHNLEDVERLCTHVALISKGRLLRMDTLASITHGTDRITYVLNSKPEDLAAINAVIPSVTLDWRENDKSIVCTFTASNGSGVAEINRQLIPAILSQADILSVTSGQKLEEAFLQTAK
jgi:ABC-2 type transport system ATP-binding protein